MKRLSNHINKDIFTINDLYASAWDEAINQLGQKYSYILEELAIKDNVKFDKNGYIVEE